MTQATLFTETPPVLDLPGYPVVWSPCRRYRYVLWRVWNEVPNPRYVMWTCLNPSKADVDCTDNTMTRVVNFSRAWGFDAMCMCNAFGYKSTDPAEMKRASDPVGPENDKWLARISDGASLRIAAWGNDGAFMRRSNRLRELLPYLHCLKMTDKGEPYHPLYLKASLIPQRMSA